MAGFMGIKGQLQVTGYIDEWDPEQNHGIS